MEKLSQGEFGTAGNSVDVSAIRPDLSSEIADRKISHFHNRSVCVVSQLKSALKKKSPKSFFSPTLNRLRNSLRYIKGIRIF